MCSVKPSTRELIWLACRRQGRLFDAAGPLAASAEPDEYCDEADCLPWIHKRSECQEFRRRVPPAKVANGNDPRT